MEKIESLTRWKKISSVLFAKNKFWSYFIDEYTIGETYKGEYHYVHTPGSTLVIPIGNDGKILLIRQYRYLNDLFGIEFPCGGIYAGLAPAENALKELREETGFTAEKLIPVGKFTPFTGASDEFCSVFIAKRLIFSPLKPDETEQIELLWFSYDEVEELIEKNEINDGLSLAAWALAKVALRSLHE